MTSLHEFAIHLVSSYIYFVSSKNDIIIENSNIVSSSDLAIFNIVTNNFNFATNIQ